MHIFSTALQAIGTQHMHTQDACGVLCRTCQARAHTHIYIPTRAVWMVFACNMTDGSLVPHTCRNRLLAAASSPAALQSHTWHSSPALSLPRTRAAEQRPAVRSHASSPPSGQAQGHICEGQEAA